MIRMAGVTVEAGGHTVLDAIDLAVAPGEHVAIVGPSGAASEPGWPVARLYRASRGSVEVDGRPLVGDWLGALRRDTAWVDPAVSLWNRSFLDNLRYGASTTASCRWPRFLSRARLREVLEHLPDGLATELGEAGNLVSGGEGQRTRVGRALGRRGARLVVLDEPFRGLDLSTRRELLTMARQWWHGATLFWVTHDIAETEPFDRVLVIDGGRIVEDDSPARSAHAGFALRAAGPRDRDMHEQEWSAAKWRRVWIERGRIREETPDRERARRSAVAGRRDRRRRGRAHPALRADRSRVGGRHAAPRAGGRSAALDRWMAAAAASSASASSR